jgi:lipid-binding SYLF domain-containing protein
MSTRCRIIGLFLLSVTVSAANVFAVNPDRKVRAANEVLREMLNAPAKGIPRSMLEDAEGVVIIPEVIKVGFVIGVQRGEGVALVRDVNRAWQPPKFVTITAGSVGWQIGAESSDFVLVFKTRKGVDGLMSGKFTIGADANAAIGPVGRQIGAATDAKLSAEIYTYSRSRGLFAGVSLAGSSLDIDPMADAAYYGTAPGSPAMGVPESATQLVTLLTQITEGNQAIGATNDAPVIANDALEQQRSAILANARALGPALDERWRQYLALPDELSTPGRTPDAQAMRKVLDRFQSVARDPKFRALNQRPEFTATRDALDRYYKTLTATDAANSPLTLPPPPAVSN